MVGFTAISSRLTPIEVVNLLNTMYSSFDALSEKNRVFKVETVGEFTFKFKLTFDFNY